jgi:hypothetical protein
MNLEPGDMCVIHSYVDEFAHLNGNEVEVVESLGSWPSDEGTIMEDAYRVRSQTRIFGAVVPRDALVAVCQ